MELFVVNRYLGDEKQAVPDEEKLKRKFLSKINERKELKLNSLRDVNGDVSQADNSTVSDHQSGKKRHKKKLSSDSETGRDEDESVPLAQSKRKREASDSLLEAEKKSKKRKSSEIVESANGSMEPIDEVSEMPKKKKRKKKKAPEQPGAIKHPTEPTEDVSSNAFLVIGKDTTSKQQKIKRVLPEWLSNPSIVSVDLKNLTTSISALPCLEPMFVEKLKANGITHFFPVQAQVIPALLSTLHLPTMFWPSDLCISAPTGSGKTLAFVLPLLQALHRRIVMRVRALVVLPVQDLATQVHRVFEVYAAVTSLKVVLLSPKKPFSEEQKLIVKPSEDGEGFRSLADILVTTPGRLVDHLASTKGFSLQDLEYLVMDEADRVMEGVQSDWLLHLNRHLHGATVQSYIAPPLTLDTLLTRKRPPRKLLFSATLSQDPEKLQQLGLFQPRLFTSVIKRRDKAGTTSEETPTSEPPVEFVGKFTSPAELKEQYTICTAQAKPLVLHHLMTRGQWRHVLCFVRSKAATGRLRGVLKRLGKGRARVGRLEAGLEGRVRERVLKNFAMGKLDVLVSSDSLARGMDIPGVEYVVSYDAPSHVKSYVHRIGRTGRAGNHGTAVTLLLNSEVNHFKSMLETAGKTGVSELVVAEEELEQYEEEFKKALEGVKKNVEIQKRRERMKRREGRGEKKEVVGVKKNIEGRGKKTSKSVKKNTGRGKEQGEKGEGSVKKNKEGKVD